ncbi:MAG: hypothetical protein ACTHK1_08510 [Actinomycetales bacterium]
MKIDQASELIRRYYTAFHADAPAGVARALADVLSTTFTLDSPLVRDRTGGPASGDAAIAIAAEAAPLLARARVDSLYFTMDYTGVVALIKLPFGDAGLWQSEHFEIDTENGAIASLRSFYDPRSLLSGSRGTAATRRS